MASHAGAGARRHRARHARGRPEGAAAHLQQHPRRHAGRLRQQEGMAIGMRLAQLLASMSATRSRWSSPAAPTTPFGTAPRIKAYPVGASSRSAWPSTTQPSSSCRWRRRSSTSTRATRCDVLEVIVDDPEQVGQLRRRHEGGRHPSMHYRLAAAQRTFFTVLEVERNVMFIILSLIIVLVAALNIISGLMMLVKDKGRDIAHPAHHGGHRARSCASSSSPAPASAWSARSPASCSASCSAGNIDEIRQFVAVADQHQVCSTRTSIS